MNAPAIMIPVFRALGFTYCAGYFVRRGRAPTEPPRASSLPIAGRRSRRFVLRAAVDEMGVRTGSGHLLPRGVPFCADFTVPEAKLAVMIEDPPRGPRGRLFYEERAGAIGRVGWRTVRISTDDARDPSKRRAAALRIVTLAGAR